MTHPHLVVVPKPLDAVPRSVPLIDGVKVIDSALDPGWAPIRARLSAARSEHKATLEAVRVVCEARAVTTQWVPNPDHATLAAATLIITVGGDGTFLTAARHAGTRPLLGVNSAPTTSIGHFCIATGETFGAALDRALAHLTNPSTGPGPLALTRIRCEIGNEVLAFEALNDVLFANRSPVSSTRYALHIGDASELHTSSGIWISSASGSTAAIYSAGGLQMEPTDKRLQWRVREPYNQGAALHLLGGLSHGPIEILSRSDKNALFIDGQSVAHKVAFGQRCRLSASPDPLYAFL